MLPKSFTFNSKGAYNKLEREKPFAERSRGEVYDLIFDRVVKYDVEETWQLQIDKNAAAPADEDDAHGGMKELERIRVGYIFLT